MNELLSAVVLIVGIAVLTLSGPFIATAFLLLRKRRARARRRSPLTANLLRGPGHALREEIDKVSSDIDTSAMALVFVPILLAGVYFAQAHLQGQKDAPIRIAVFGIAWLGVIVVSTIKLLKHSIRMDALRAGLDAEMAVGQELDQLMRQGAVVFHDFPAESFNIDHVVVAPQGVFAVETKGYTKLNKKRGKIDATVVFDGQMLKFPDWTTAEPIEQARRQADWLAKWLSSATGSAIPVVPVLALPGWFVDRRGRNAVRLFSGKELGNLLKINSGKNLSEQDVQRVVHQVEQRCRNVKPGYRPIDP